MGIDRESNWWIFYWRIIKYVDRIDSITVPIITVFCTIDTFAQGEQVWLLKCQLSNLFEHLYYENALSSMSLSDIDTIARLHGRWNSCVSPLIASVKRLHCVKFWRLGQEDRGSRMGFPCRKWNRDFLSFEMLAVFCVFQHLSLPNMIF